jgi:hypothetical protein
MQFKAEVGAEFLPGRVSATVRQVILGLWGVALVTGCSTNKPSFWSGPVQDVGPQTGSAQVEPGALVVRVPLQPASFSFQPGTGQLETAGDGAARSARAVLDTPNLLHPQLEAVAGVVGFVVAPFAAGYGAVSAPRQKAPPDKLLEAEASLSRAMSAMAVQENLQQALLRSVGEQSHRRVLSLAPGSSASTCDAASAVIEAGLEELRLERTGAGDSSYALRIKARARLVRQADGVVLADRRYEYTSGKAMFIDWTRQGSVEGVAQTGYRRVADEMAGELLTLVTEPPVLMGAGYRSAPATRTGPRATLAFHTAPVRRAGLQPVAYYPPAFTSFEIRTTGSANSLSLQRPLTRAEAVAEAQSDLEYQFDGLENDRNAVVQLLACLAAVPVGLWEQATILVRGVSSAEAETAEARLRAAARQAQPQATLTREVARALAPESSTPAMLARAETASFPETSSTWVLCAASKPISAAAGGMPGQLTGSDAGEVTLEIHMSEAALSGKPGINPPLALRVQAQVTLVRARDGQELYSCPVRYCSRERTFKDWATHDAGLFRRELDLCYRQMAAGLAERLVKAGLVPLGQIGRDAIAQY